MTHKIFVNIPYFCEYEQHSFDNVGLKRGDSIAV